MFAGNAMLELQDARLIGVTPLTFMPSVPAIGLFPTLESVAAQGLLLLALVPVLGGLILKRARAAS